MRVLFVTSTRIGDAVLSTGLLNHLGKTIPEAQITVAVGYLPAPLFTQFPAVKRIIPLRKHRFGLHWSKLWISTFGSVWDIVIDLRGSALGWLLLSKQRKIICKPLPNEHRVETLARMMNLSSPPSPVLPTGSLPKRIAKKHIGGKTTIGLGVTANWPPKIWPADRFISLAENIIGVNGPFHGARLAVFGGPGEEDIARPVLDALGPSAANFVGNFDICATAALIEKCGLFIGNDSGLMHMAAALNVPTIGLFGPSPPEQYAPWGENCRAISGDVSYRELVNNPTFDHQRNINLMTGLSTKKVLSAVTALANDISKNRLLS